MSAKRLPKNSQTILPAPSTTSTLPPALILTGILLAALSYSILGSTPLTALGISTVIIGTISYAIAKGQPKIPPQASAILLQAGEENISALVEEIGLQNKAIYLPTSMTGDKPKALIPLNSQIELGKKVLPKRLIVKYGAKPEDVGLLVITPGSAVASTIEAKPDGSAGDLESAISQILSGMLSLADGIRISMLKKGIVAEVLNPRLENRNMWIYEVIGTPIASMVASVTAVFLDKPVTISREETLGDRLRVELTIEERQK